MSEQVTDDDRQTMEEYYDQKKREKKQELLEAGLMDSGPTENGDTSHAPGETQTCRKCGETTPAKDWTPAGPTGTQRNGVRMQTIVGEYCPACGHFQ